MAAAWFASFSIGWCFFHLFWVSLHPLFSHMGRARFGEWALTGPAGPDHDRGLRPRGVDEAVVVDQGRVVRDAIHVKRDRRELQVEGVMVPLIITDLRQSTGSAKEAEGEGTWGGGKPFLTCSSFQRNFTGLALSSNGQ